MFIPGPDLDFLFIQDPRSRGQKGTGSWIQIRNTDSKGVISKDDSFKQGKQQLSKLPKLSYWYHAKAKLSKQTIFLILDRCNCGVEAGCFPG